MSPSHVGVIPNVHSHPTATPNVCDNPGVTIAHGVCIRESIVFENSAITHFVLYSIEGIPNDLDPNKLFAMMENPLTTTGV